MKQTRGVVGIRARKATLAVLGALVLAVLAAPALAAVRSDATPIVIPSSGTAAPYPATVKVSGLPGLVTDVNVTLKDINHTAPSDLDILLVGPGGQGVMLVGDAGGGVSGFRNVFLTLDDEAEAGIGAQQSGGGTFRPTDLDPGETLPAPAPEGPYGATLAGFDGRSPNGEWRLFVADDAAGEKGSIAGGFSLNIKTDTPPPNDAFAAPTPLEGSQTYTRSNNAAATLEPGEPVGFGGAEHSVWFSWTAQTDGPTTLKTCSSDFDTALNAYTGAALNALTPRARDDDGCPTPNRLGSKATFDAAAGQNYRVQVLGTNADEEGAFSLKVVGNAPPRIVISEPPPTTTVRRPPVSATVRDAYSDLFASDVKLFLDGAEVPDFRYYRASDTLAYRPATPLSYGQHSIKIEAADHQGVRAERTRTFTVVRP